MSDISALQTKYRSLAGVLDERAFRVCLAADALALGYGGVSRVARAASVSRNTVQAGIRELRDPGRVSEEAAGPRRIRRPGGGRKALAETDETLLGDLDRLLEPVTRGDPESLLRWTCKSTTNLAGELHDKGHVVSYVTVWRLLDELGYSMQANRKTREGTEHPDRNAQFEFINATAQEFLAQGQPVISVDTKKKELVGPYKNAGREWQRKGAPVAVNMHDFADPALGKVIPYGVYDLRRNEGWVSVGISHDTAQFAVEAIRRWWGQMGQQVYPAAAQLLITADGGGSNGARVRLWKVELQRLADETGLQLHVRHFPPGTSKWNKIEHRLFCHITENWRGRPLISRLAVVELIAATHTDQGLVVRAELDEGTYETKKSVSDDEMAAVNIERCDFHGEWNYSLAPRGANTP
jgi:transposase-like protein